MRVWVAGGGYFFGFLCPWPFPGPPLPFPLPLPWAPLPWFPVGVDAVELLGARGSRTAPEEPRVREGDGGAVLEVVTATTRAGVVGRASSTPVDDGPMLGEILLAETCFGVAAPELAVRGGTG